MINVRSKRAHIHFHNEFLLLFVDLVLEKNRAGCYCCELSEFNIMLLQYY